MATDKETIESLYNLLQAVVTKMDGSIELTKDEFLRSLDRNFTIQHETGNTYLRVWNISERSDNRISVEDGKRGGRESS